MSISASHFVVPVVVPGVLTTGVKPGFVLPWAARLVSIAAYLNTVPAGSSVLFTVTQNGTSVTGSNLNPDGPLAIAAAAHTLTGGPVVSTDLGVAAGTNVYAPIVKDGSDVAVFAVGDVVALNVTQIGSGTAGSDLNVTLAFVKL